MGSKDSKPPPTWEDVIQYAEAFSYKPLDIIKMVHDKTKIKTKVEVFIIYGLIHRLPPRIAQEIDFNDKDINKLYI